jgi:pimeloyl-ACP methyl ester carboxylesterase
MYLRSMPSRLVLAIVVVALTLAGAAATAGARSIRTVWMPGYAAPETPEKLDQVGIVKIGSTSAKNVLVIEPGTSGGGAYFVPLAKWIVEKAPGWQVWAVERRENRLEKHSELNKFKHGQVTPQQFFRYYLGYITEGSTEKHYNPISEKTAIKDGARGWGMNVAVQDLHVVVEAAKALGGKVVLGGHSLGGTVVTAYASWDFAGKPGADGLSGLVFDDGGSSPAAPTAKEAEEALEKLSKKTPWLAFGGIPAPYLGLFSATGSALADLAPNEPSLAQKWPLLPSFLKPRNPKGEEVPATNEATFGYGINVGTSPPNLAAAQAHVGEGLIETTPGQPWAWNSTGAITPVQRYAQMLSGADVAGADGSEWYYPERLTIDSSAVGNGKMNPAQAVLGEDAIHGGELPTSLHILAINSELDTMFGEGFNTLKFAEELAEQSAIPSGNVTLVDVRSTYAHNDTNGAYPNNELVSHLVPFLEGL